MFRARLFGVVSHVPSRTFEVNCRCGEYLIQPAATFAAFDQWFIADFLKNFGVRLTLTALVLIYRHSWASLRIGFSNLAF